MSWRYLVKSFLKNKDDSREHGVKSGARTSKNTMMSIEPAVEAFEWVAKEDKVIKEHEKARPENPPKKSTKQRSSNDPHERVLKYNYEKSHSK